MARKKTKLPNLAEATALEPFMDMDFDAAYHFGVNPDGTSGIEAHGAREGWHRHGRVRGLFQHGRLMQVDRAANDAADAPAPETAADRATADDIDPPREIDPQP